MPIVRFLPRREGEIKNEIFVKPAKVKNIIPVIDDAGVLDQGKSCSSAMFPLIILFVIKTLQRIMTAVPPTFSQSAQRIKRKRKRRKRRSLKTTLITKAIQVKRYQIKRRNTKKGTKKKYSCIAEKL